LQWRAMPTMIQAPAAGRADHGDSRGAWVISEKGTRVYSRRNRGNTVICRVCTALLPAFLAAVAFADGPADNMVDKVRPVPPAGIALPDNDRAELQSGVDSLGKEIDALRQELKIKPALLELLPDVQIYYNAVRYALTYTELSFIDGRQKSPGEFTPPHAFVLHPYGRYCNANKFAGEVDLFEALAHVRKHYAIDDNRLVMRGFSMGGAACWQFAVHYAGLW